MTTEDWDDDSQQGGTGDNDQFAKLRQHARDLEKARKVAEKELEELRAFKAEADERERLNQTRELLRDMGLPPKVAGLYKGETTPEAVAAWVKEYGDVFGIQSTPQVEESGAFSPTAIGIPPTTTYTYEQYRQLLDTEPEKAAEAVQEGRVQGFYKQPQQAVQ